MNLRELCQHRVYVSRADRPDRRRALLPRLAAVGLADTALFPAISLDALRGDTRGFFSLPKRSLSIGKRLCLRAAAHTRAEAMLFLEDDVVFHNQFTTLIEQIRLPDDWAIFYLGCQHIQPPELIGGGLVRVTQAFDSHAVIFRASAYQHARRSMRGLGKGQRGELHGDVLLSELHSQLPTYACYPNLAWQACDRSDMSGVRYSNYDSNGRQNRLTHVLP